MRSLELMPWKSSWMTCQSCVASWIAVRELGSPIKCPYCNSEEVVEEDDE